jgi:hypothetical protein
MRENGCQIPYFGEIIIENLKIIILTRIISYKKLSVQQCIMKVKRYFKFLTVRDVKNIDQISLQ